jgi:hypothetical protein
MVLAVHQDSARVIEPHEPLTSCKSIQTQDCQGNFSKLELTVGGLGQETYCRGKRAVYRCIHVVVRWFCHRIKEKGNV